MSFSAREPFQILPIFRERVWGRTSLAPLFPQVEAAKPIGEAWLTSEENRVVSGTALGDLVEEHPEILGRARDPRHPRQCPLLVKFLFTTERLSVQVHPDDEYAEKHHQSLGKTEAWYVMDADERGEVAVGFKEQLTPERLRASAQSGEIEALLDWRKVKPGDVIYTPAGTVHAIGAGLTICEIQENSDLTYRLYDYGRPRELHLDHGVKVSHLGPHTAGTERRVLADWRHELAVSPYFRIEHWRPAPAVQVSANLPQYLLLIALHGRGQIAGKDFEAGQCWMVPAGSEPVRIDGPGSEWIATYTAKEAIGAE
jgi:mannose-6-phosphate isomerase